MNFLYNILIYITEFFLRIIALFNKKIKLFISGRKETFLKLSVIKPSDKVVWFHAASLGEFEQASPILEQIKREFTTHKIVVTFFSPSGYEIRKNYALADVVCYLPFDTKKKTAKFIQKIHPDISILIKYEFWPNLLSELKRTNTKTILVSGIFRKNQAFFKWYGKWMRKHLSAFDFFFLQDENSKKLLNTIGFKNTIVSGDTRFDRVNQILQQNNQLDFIADFKNNCFTLVVGSSWEQDEEIIIRYINECSLPIKFIIAPHQIKKQNIERLQRMIVKPVVLFSEKENKTLSDYTVFIIDTIGLLTKIYTYADVAFVGGGFQKGLHNILEPATYGIPILFGDRAYNKFKEANDLLKLEGAFAINNYKEFCIIFEKLQEHQKNSIAGNICKNYVGNNIGATQQIINYLKQHI